MKTINAKELRLKLDETFDSVISGEDVIVTHRFKKPVRISLANPNNASKINLTGLKAFDTADKKKSPYDKNEPIKELYKKSIEKKYAK